LHLLRRYLPLATVAVALAAFYLYQLDRVGVLSTDEPRYAAIGLAMEQSGDYVTPRLWGAPWFEKPPLLYWMTAAGRRAGWNPERAARLPVVLLSLLFLGISFELLRREFGGAAASFAVILLGTSAGWVAYSSVCVTDVPLAVFFSLAVFLALPLAGAAASKVDSYWRFAAIGACLGIATLAKGLVPLALILPALWFLRSCWRKWWVSAFACCAVAGPWYTAVWVRNGRVFFDEFFLKHHFERLYSPVLQHVQPWYYYIPILLGALFPWTPLLALFLWPRLRRTAQPWDGRRRLLLATVLFGFLFFSASVNKLPGYLLPLLPALCALLGAQFERRDVTELGRAWLAPCALLIASIALLAQALPVALSAGRASALEWGPLSPTECFYVVAPLLVLLLARRSWVLSLLVLSLLAGGFYLKTIAYPVLDEQVSARGLWRQISRVRGTVCDGGINRDWAYGLSFYQGAALAPCSSGKFDFALRAKGREKPVLEAIKVK
jgi:4-amino-4-deoxy-L-arabinose transferase-like glycosyltransferase